jgi:ketosteroid isomerase-like protein
MSQENVDLLRRGYEYVQRTGEFPPETAHPNFVWDTTTFRGGMQPETCVGVDEVNRWLAEWVDGFDNWSLDIEEVIDAGDRVVTSIRQRANPRHGGPEIEMRMSQVWTFRDGRIARWRCMSTAPRPSKPPAVGVGDVAGERGNRARSLGCLLA